MAAAAARAERGRAGRRRGAEAEDAACAYLQAQGLRLLARNVRYPFGELDAVALHGGTLVFVEVRFRRGTGYGGAFGSVDAAKRRKCVRAAQAWLKGHAAFAQAPCRFDVVAVTPGAPPRCEWIRAAFALDDAW